VVPPLAWVWGGESADVAGRWEGGGLESGWVLVGAWRAPKIMGARAPILRAPKIIGARPHLGGRFGDFLIFFIAAKS
jgi:hypothetical protein